MAREASPASSTVAAVATGRVDAGPVRAAGACVWRPSGGEVEVLLVHRPKYDDWSLPKGKLDDGEHLLSTAVREVAEETGHRVVLGRPLPVQRYWAQGRPKVVAYWSARADDAAPPWPGTEEVDELRWFAAWQAAAALSHPRDADIVRALVSGPPATVPVIVLRHADAVARKSWEGPDEERPLAPEGERAAALVAPLLAAYGVRRVISSDTARCIATVQHFASAAGIAVQTEHRLSEAGHEADPGGAAAALLEAVRAGEPTVLSTHRPVLPVLREAIEVLGVDGVEVRAAHLRTTELLVAHHARGQVVGVEAHSPPRV